MCLFYLDVRQLKLGTIATNGVDKIGISMTLNWFILNVVIIMIILSGTDVKLKSFMILNDFMNMYEIWKIQPKLWQTVVFNINSDVALPTFEYQTCQYERVTVY